MVFILFQIKLNPALTNKFWFIILGRPAYHCGLINDHFERSYSIWYCYCSFHQSMNIWHFKLLGNTKYGRHFTFWKWDIIIKVKHEAKVENRKCYFKKILKCIFTVNKMHLLIHNVFLEFSYCLIKTCSPWGWCGREIWTSLYFSHQKFWGSRPSIWILTNTLGDFNKSKVWELTL